MKSMLAKLPWLEVALVATSISLVLQLFPAVGTALLDLLDVRNWSRSTWFVVNLGFVGLLLIVRFTPTVRLIAWYERIADAFRWRNRLTRKERAAFKAKLEERQLARELAAARKHRG
jgi:hypothetical protein